MDKENWEPIYLVSSKESNATMPMAHIYDYARVPDAIDKNITFITVELNVANPIFRSNLWMNTSLIINIVSHQDHMRIGDEVPTSANRNDYLSMLIDKKINGITKDYGTFKLISNRAGNENKPFLNRTMVFESQELSKDICDTDDEY